MVGSGVLGVSNKMPEVVANYYINAVTRLKALPVKIRADDGTENSIVEAMQITLRSGHSDENAGLSSFVVGTSPADQKIECYWSQMLRDRPGWWRDFFDEEWIIRFKQSNRCGMHPFLFYGYLKN